MRGVKKVTKGNKRLYIVLVVSWIITIIVISILVIGEIQYRMLSKQTETQQNEMVAEVSNEQQQLAEAEQKQQIEAETQQNASENTESESQQNTEQTEVKQEDETSEESEMSDYELSFYVGKLVYDAVQDDEELKVSLTNITDAFRNGNASIETIEAFNRVVVEKFQLDMIDLDYKLDVDAWWAGKCFAEFDSQIKAAHEAGRLSDDAYAEYVSSMNEIFSEVSEDTFNAYAELYVKYIM